MSALPKIKHPPDIWHEYIFGQVINEQTACYVQKELETVNKRVAKLRNIAEFISLQSTSFDKVNCFVCQIIRYKDNRDDIARFMIKSDEFERFDVCINTQNDFKVIEIAYKVHSLSANRRKVLVSSLRKVKGPEAHIDRAVMIHRARNFEIRKI